ncbi:unnamed protein product [Cunninghamella echinulata]
MTVNDLDVMRRRSDSYLNATQILKLSGFDKGKRTKILEREILDSIHEKIQGGYGKYQGTWVPLERGRELADRYEVLDLLLPLIEFDASKWDELPEKEQMPTKSARLRNNYALTNPQHSTPPTSPSNVSSPLDTSTTTNTTSLYKRKLTSIENDDTNPLTPLSSQSQPSSTTTTAPHLKKKIKPQSHGKQKQHNKDKDNNKDNNKDHENNNGNDNNGSSSQSLITANKDEDTTTNEGDFERCQRMMLSIFNSEDDHLPPLLRGAGATNGLDMDVTIDEHGNSALHWSVSMARIHITEWLISKGANPCRLNHKSETPLMRGVMTPSCFENECFPHMLDILKDSLLLVDCVGRSVLHHIILSTVNTTYTGQSPHPLHPPPSSSSSPSESSQSQPLMIPTTSSELRLQAAMGYMQHVLKVIHQLKLEYIINKVDTAGESPYDMALRLQCIDLCQLLTQSDNNNNNHDNNSQLENDSTNNRKRSLGAELSSMDKKISEQLKKQKKRGEKKSDKKSNKELQSVDTLNTISTSSTRGQELAITVQRFVDAMDTEFSKTLQYREAELTRMQLEIQELSQQLEKERNEWNTTLKKNTQQLNEAHLRIKQLEEMLNKTSLHHLENGTNNNDIIINTPITSTHIIDNNNNNNYNNKDSSESDKTRKLEEMEQKYLKAVEKELECKRLIAACCHLPIDTIDEFIEPLTLAIENDPPDMDFTRVIGFMEKLRQHQQ